MAELGGKRMMSLDPNTFRKQGYMIEGTGGSDPGELGISPSENTWSDVRMPFRRSHVIPYQLPGIMSSQPGYMNQNKPWMGWSPMGDEMASFRYPVTLSIPTQQTKYENNQSITTGVLPSMSVDPYGSLPDELKVPLFGFGRTATT
jgi:hypothetical protein